MCQRDELILPAPLSSSEAKKGKIYMLYIPSGMTALQLVLLQEQHQFPPVEIPAISATLRSADRAPGAPISSIHILQRLQKVPIVQIVQIVHLAQGDS